MGSWSISKYRTLSTHRLNRTESELKGPFTGSKRRLNGRFKILTPESPELYLDDGALKVPKESIRHEKENLNHCLGCVSI